MEKKTTAIIRIAVSIAVLIIVIPVLINSFSNLQQINQEKENAKQVWIPLFQYVIQTCVNATGIASDNCKQSIKMEMQSCSFYDNPSVCSDPRIDRIMTSTAQTVIVAPSTNFVTYTNNQYGFSIDYPSNWVINNKPDGNVGLEDKLIAPNFLVKVKTIQNTGSSFDQIASTYVNQGGIEGFPITVQSQDNVTIGNKEAYRIQYSEPTVSTSCRNKDYLINDGQFVHVISFNNCDENIYASFLPTFEKMISTFRSVSTSQYGSQSTMSSIGTSSTNYPSTSQQAVFSPCPTTDTTIPSPCLGRYLPTPSDMGSEWTSQNGQSIPVGTTPSSMITQYVNQDYENIHANPEEVFDVWIEEWKSDDTSHKAFKSEENSASNATKFVGNPLSNDTSFVYIGSEFGSPSYNSEIIVGTVIIKVEGVGDGQTTIEDMGKISKIIINKVENSKS